MVNAGLQGLLLWPVDIHLSTVENDFFKTPDIKLLAGRPFSEELTADSASLILNETAARQFGYDPAALSAGRSTTIGKNSTTK